MYVGFRYHHKYFPEQIQIIVEVNPTAVVEEGIGKKIYQPDWTPTEMKRFVGHGYWIPEEPLVTAILKALKNAL